MSGRYPDGLTYSPQHVDDAHLLLCFGCPACAAAAERDEREFNRRARRGY